MNKLSIERMKQMRTTYYELQYENVVIALDELIAIREVKGESVPVAWTDAEELRGMEKDGCGYLFKVDPAKPFTDPRRQIMLYDRQQKPVISKEKLCDWLEDEFDITNGQRDALAADFAHCYDCTVSDNKAIDALTNL